MHLPSVRGLGGQGSDVWIYAQDLIRTKRRPNGILTDRSRPAGAGWLLGCLEERARRDVG